MPSPHRYRPPARVVLAQGMHFMAPLRQRELAPCGPALQVGKGGCVFGMAVVRASLDGEWRVHVVAVGAFGWARLNSAAAVGVA